MSRAFIIVLIILLVWHIMISHICIMNRGTFSDIDIFDPNPDINRSYRVLNIEPIIYSIPVIPTHNGQSKNIT